jgi:uncharacterized membrane protein YgdD (TMEM256/DUF423 family)
MINKLFVKIGALLGAISVVIGAFGAHAFKKSLVTNGNWDTFETANKYLFYSVFLIIITGLLSAKYPNKWNKYGGYLSIAGAIIFSGSLYLICITNSKAFGAIAPIGGICLIAGWLSLYLSINNQ